MEKNDDKLERTNVLLQERLRRLAPCTGRYEIGIPGLSLYRYDETATPENCFYAPGIVVIAQGLKHTVMGNNAYQYGAKYCVVNGVDLPSSRNHIEASREIPYLSVALRVDQALATSLSGEIDANDLPVPQAVAGVSVMPVDPDVLDAFLRLTELADDLIQLPVLAPMIIREIHYRILIGPQGGCLRQAVTQGTHTNQVAKAITWLRENYKDPIHVHELAKSVDLPTSTFHRQFKQVTSLSPVQYQKRLRLYEAQRLMLANDRDATGAAMAVGYESPTQFSREYKRLFGEPPHRDISRMRRL